MKRLTILLAGMALSVASMAQQALWDKASAVSPVENADGSVTFNLFAPNAQKVEVSGDFNQISGMTLPMTKNDKGMWTVTTKPLAPELYSYSFNVDGMRMVDPSNTYMNRDITTYSSLFIVSKEKGDRGSLYSVNNVPHGTVAKVWYDSPTLGLKRLRPDMTARNAIPSCISCTAWAATRTHGANWAAPHRYSTTSSPQARPSR